MNGTIRQYIKRRVWWCAGVAFAGWLMFPLGAAIAKNLPSGAPAASVPVIGFVMFFGALLAMRRIVKCPSCKARLGHTIAMPLAFSWGSGPKVNFCPFCGVNLDQPMPHSEAVQPHNPLDPIK